MVNKTTKLTVFCGMFKFKGISSINLLYSSNNKGKTALNWYKRKFDGECCSSAKQWIVLNKGWKICFSFQLSIEWPMSKTWFQVFRAFTKVKVNFHLSETMQMQHLHCSNFGCRIKFKPRNKSHFSTIYFKVWMKLFKYSNAPIQIE